MRIFSDSRVDVTEVLKIGTGMTLEQTADGTPVITGVFASTVLAAVEFMSTDFDPPVYDTPSSDGVRLMLWPHDIGPTDAGHAIGVDSGVLWYGVGGTSNTHKWYGGEDEWMSLAVNVGSNPRLRLGTLTGVVADARILSLQAVAETSDGSNFHIAGYFQATMTANSAFSIQGVEGYGKTTNTSGSVTLAIGAIGNVEHDGTGGTVTTARAVQAGVVLTAGTMTAGMGVYIAPAIKTAGTFTTMYGIYIDSQTVASTNYQLYSAGTALSKFAGPLEIGTYALLNGHASPYLRWSPSSGATKIAEIVQTANQLIFNDAGVANLWRLDLAAGYLSALKTTLNPPTFSTISSGARIVLWESDLGVANATHSIGVDTDTMWYGVGGTANSHKWYGGTSLWMSLGLSFANPRLRLGTLSGVFNVANVLSVAAVSQTSDGSAAHLGGYFQAEMTANTANSIQGLEGYALTTNTSSSVALAIGSIGNVEHNGTGGTVTTARAIQAGVILTAGTMTEGIGVYIAPAVKSAGTFTTNYGLYIASQTVASTNYQLYSAGTAPSYLAGTLLVAENSNPNSAHVRVKKASGQNAFEVDVDSAVPGLYVVSKSGALRWRWGSDGATESGGSVGNDWKLFSYNDAGSFIGSAIVVTRSTLAVALGGTLSWGGGAAISNSNAIVGTGRLVSAGTGLTGGGDLSADRTISIDTSVVPQKAVAETITALWTFPTINVNQGSGSAGAVRLFAQSVSGQSAAVFRCNDESANPYILIAGGNGLSDPVSIRVGGALKNIQVDGSGFLIAV